KQRKLCNVILKAEPSLFSLSPLHSLFFYLQQKKTKKQKIPLLKMAEFLPNLDDGERYLPSDIFNNESHFSWMDMDMDNLAHHFATLSLLQQHRHTPPKLTPNNTRPTNFQRFEEPVHFRSVNPTLLNFQFNGVNGGDKLYHRLYGYDIRPFVTGSDPFYEYHLLKPTQTQVDRYLEARARILQHQKQRQLQLQVQNRLLQNSALPFRGRTGFVRESGGGTGVFHPRIANATASTATATDGKRKQGLRMRQAESKATQQRNSLRRASGSKHKDSHYHLPPEMVLPRDWTY
ncbi:hypothetical protein CFOL_v3_00857, partial [Cephalotus follicularis]